MKIGLFGGTFDPVHSGHLILSRDATELLGLERVILIPNIISPHKQGSAPTPSEIRMAMLEAAVTGEPGLEVSDVELRRGGPSFTIDTVIFYRQRHPDAELFYLIGADNVPALDTWHRIEELRRLVRFVVFSRGVPDAGHGFPVLGRRIDISATEIRERVAKGLPIRYLVPDAVRELIERHQLYRESHHH